jgi:hypothetical protein
MIASETTGCTTAPDASSIGLIDLSNPYATSVFTLQYPDGWNAENRGGNSVRLFPDGIALRVEVEVSSAHVAELYQIQGDLTGASNPREFLEIFLDTFAAAADPESLKPQIQEMTLGDKPAARLEFLNRLLVVVQDGSDYALINVIPDDQSLNIGDYTSTVLAIAATIDILDESTPPEIVTTDTSTEETPSVTDEVVQEVVETIDVGAEITGEITDGQSQNYTFEGQTGDIVTFTMNSTDFTPMMIVTDPNGLGLGLVNGYGSGEAKLGPITLAADGTYTILASSTGSHDSGSFQLFVTKSLSE